MPATAPLPGYRPIHVLLIDDHRSVMWGLGKLIESMGAAMRLVASTTCHAEALAAAQEHRPDVVLLDVDLGDEDGLDLIAQLRHHAAKALVLTGMRDPKIAERAALAGARGLVHKSEPAEVILKAIECVNAGELWFDRLTIGRVLGALSTRPAGAPRPLRGNDALTLAERRIVASVVQHKGSPNKVIAGILRISEHTLRNHLASIYPKLGVRHRLDLVLYAMQHDLHRLSE